MPLSTSEVSTTSIPLGSLDPHFAMPRAIFRFYYSTDTRSDLLEGVPPFLSALMIRRRPCFICLTLRGAAAPQSWDNIPLSSGPAAGHCYWAIREKLPLSSVKVQPFQICCNAFKNAVVNVAKALSEH